MEATYSRMVTSGRPAEATLGVRALRPVVSGLRALGHDPAPLLAAAQLDERVLADPDARVPARQVMALLAHAVTLTGDPDLGLHLAIQAPLADFDVHAYCMLSSATLGAAYERLCRYQRLINDTTRVTLTVDGVRATLRHELLGAGAIPRQSAEFVVAAWLRVGREATGLDWSPEQVRFAHTRPPGLGELAAYFRCPLVFSAGENAMAFPAALLAHPCRAADPGLLAVLDRHADQLLDRLPATHSLADRVRAVLPAALRRGEARAAAVAGRMHMSVRTLQRGLAAEQTSFADILDRVRHEIAVRELAERRLSVGEVAFLLGFAELSSFYRAFRRWTGRPPGAFREAIAESGPR